MSMLVPRNPLPVKPLAVALVASCLLGTVAAFAFRLAGSVSGEFEPGFLTAALVAPLCVLLAGVAGLYVFVNLARHDRRRLPAAVMASSGVRLFGSVAMAYGLYAAMALPKGPFWQAFLVAGVLALVVETIVVNRALPALMAQSGEATS
ncbi:MAG: hypothetical protein LW650_12250 [Planctomycetaceae bacterium]|jgi:hypothetical protein|nr:hypothetical protein [Planctomycetaceae bacterium]